MALLLIALSLLRGMRREDAVQRAWLRFCDKLARGSCTREHRGPLDYAGRVSRGCPRARPLCAPSALYASSVTARRPTGNRSPVSSTWSRISRREERRARRTPSAPCRFACAQPSSYQNRKDVKEFVAEMVKKHGFNRRERPGARAGNINRRSSGRWTSRPSRPSLGRLTARSSSSRRESTPEPSSGPATPRRSSAPQANTGYRKTSSSALSASRRSSAATSALIGSSTLWRLSPSTTPSAANISAASWSITSCSRATRESIPCG